MFEAKCPALPTFDKLGVLPPSDVDPAQTGRTWLKALCLLLTDSPPDVNRIVHDLLHNDPWWRDLFALTWDMRTFHGQASISQFLSDRLPLAPLSDITFSSAEYEQPFPDLAWVRVDFTFSAGEVEGSGTARLVYEGDGVWRAVTVGTNLEGLKGRGGSFDTPYPFHGTDAAQSAEQHRLDAMAADREPEVLIVGAGQNGLAAAARLRHQGVSCVVVEKNERVGDNWRKYYESLRLHGPSCVSHMPYLNFPDSLPAFLSARQFADWLELYASALNLDVRTSTSVNSVVRDKASGKWSAILTRGGAESVVLVDHVIFAVGYTYKRPTFEGQDDFHGEVVHSSEFLSAKPYVGRRVAVVGACASGHDVASDCADLGIDVTMIQRSSTYVISNEKGVIPAARRKVALGPLEDVDRREESLPLNFTKLLAQRRAPAIMKADEEMLEGLKHRGYRINTGIEGAGLLLHLFGGGGNYQDKGACQKIIQGKIKVTSGHEIASLTEHGIIFDDGSELETDVIILATGFADSREAIRKLVDDTVSSALPCLDGLDHEGEMRGIWRECAPNMWVALGGLRLGRFYTKHLALQIKAKLLGMRTERYSDSTDA